jgi:hypothetical protein
MNFQKKFTGQRDLRNGIFERHALKNCASKASIPVD